MTRWLGILAAALFGLLASLAPASAFPVGTTCGANATNADQISKSDVTFRGNDADDCFGLQDGNINSASDLNTAVPSWGGAFVIADATGGSGTTVDGVTFTLTSTGSTAGDWTLSYSADPNVTKTYDLSLAIKASDAWSAWLFEDEVFTTDGSGNGTWLIHWDNNEPCPTQGTCSPPDLGHMIAFIQPSAGQTGNEQSTGQDQVETGNEQTTGQNDVVVPVPAPLALIGIGLIGLAVGGGLRRRR